MKRHTTDGKNSVFSGRTEIARSYLASESSERRYDVRILQGMRRSETIKKICADCPDFAEANDITPSYYPYLFSK